MSGRGSQPGRKGRIGRKLPPPKEMKKGVELLLTFLLPTPSPPMCCLFFFFLLSPREPTGIGECLSFSNPLNPRFDRVPHPSSSAYRPRPLPPPPRTYC